jgi:hypothetical protein
MRQDPAVFKTLDLSAGVSNTARGVARRFTRWLSALWLRQFRRSVVARADCF